MLIQVLTSELKRWQIKSACKVIAHLKSHEGDGLFEIARSAGMWKATCAVVVSQCVNFGYLRKDGWDQYYTTATGGGFLELHSHLRVEV